MEIEVQHTQPFNQGLRLVLRHDRLATTEAYLADNPRLVERRVRALTPRASRSRESLAMGELDAYRRLKTSGEE